MRNILLIIEYDGSEFHGWQYQPDVRTVQGDLEEAIKAVTGEDITVAGTSRTDAGVHGMCNLAVFDSQMNMEPEKYAYALNSMLPGDIVVRRSLQVKDDLHPRKIKTIKTYRYRIDNETFPDPLKKRYSWHVSYILDIDLMRQGAAYMLGSHDFSSFCAAGSTALSHVRSIDNIEISKHDNEIYIDVTGGGFLYNMVRIIAGTLMDVGRGKIEPEQIKDIIEAKDRTKAGPTAPPEGLTLLNIDWER